MTLQTDKAKECRRLHGPNDRLVLYNIWDAGSAKAVVRAGVKAVAAGSWSVAAAQGYEDGEHRPLDDALAVVGRIVTSVDCRVSVDFEGGYAADPDTLGQNVHRLLTPGVIGLNFEDQVVQAQGLYSIEDQVKRLCAVRDAAEGLGIPAFINTRTDVCLQAAPNIDHASLLDEALARAEAYAAAGADGFFVPGLTDKRLIRSLCAAVTLPVNVMAADPQDCRDLADLGVSRVSFGPHPYLRLAAALERDAAACF